MATLASSDVSTISLSVAFGTVSAQKSMEEKSAKVAEDAATVVAEPLPLQLEDAKSSSVVAVNHPNALQKTVVDWLKGAEKAMVV